MSYEAARYGERQPYPAEGAGHRVNKLGTLLLDYRDDRPRPVHELLGEWLEKSEFFLVPHPEQYGLTALGGFTPDLASRRRSGDSPYGDLSGVEGFLRYAWLYEGLRVLRSGAEYPAPDGKRLRFGERDFRSSFGDSPWQAEGWIERNRRNLELTKLRPFAQDRQSAGREGAFFADGPPPSAAQLIDLEQRHVRPGKGELVMATFLVPIAVAASACAPVQEVPTATQVVPTRTPTATRTPEPSPTALSGGPDDERMANPTAPWPSLEEIPRTRTDGGPFTFDAEAANVRAQLEAVKRIVRNSGWTIVETPDRLTTGKTAYIAPFQDQDQWSIQALTSDGVLVPIRTDGAVMDRPDWATQYVRRYEELETGLGSGFPTRFELVNDHWVAVVRSNEGELAGFYNLYYPQGWVFDETAIGKEYVEELTDHPNDVSTWPAESQRYMNDPWRFVGQSIEARTDAFVTESRRAFFLSLDRQNPALLNQIFSEMRNQPKPLLQTSGANNSQVLERITPKELQWTMIIHNNAIEQEELVLTPNEIRVIVSDASSVVFPWIEGIPNGESVRQGMFWGSVTQGEYGAGYFFSHYSYSMDVFGQETSIPRFPIGSTAGRLMGIVRLPGSTGAGMLLGYKDQQGGWHLQVFHVVYQGEAIPFDQTMEQCHSLISGSNEGYSDFLCPDYLLSTQFETGTYMGRATRMTDEFSAQWLSWPGTPVSLLSQYIPTHWHGQANYVTKTFHHPKSGLEIAQKVRLVR